MSNKNHSYQDIFTLTYFRNATIKHWSEDRNFGPRSFFRHTTDPAQLIISTINKMDSGTYKCRIDFRLEQFWDFLFVEKTLHLFKSTLFRMSQTVVFLIELKIVDVPRKLQIQDLKGNIVSGMIGPYR